MKSLAFILLLAFSIQAYTQVVHPPLGRTSTPENNEIKLTLIAKIHGYSSSTKDAYDIYEPDIISPKSAVFLEEKA